ncbi:hypothetical protein FZC66_20105 [Priestia megaterium]|nr:hypothetical protein FZC66_20105 [Priestia megaterium]
MNNTMIKNDLFMEKAEKELGRYFELAVDGVENLGMPDNILDKVWHEKLENPEEYLKFCNNTVGCYIEHGQLMGEGEPSWIKNYEDKFGKLDPIWFTNDKGSFNEGAYNSYINTGKVKMSWNCNAIPLDEKDPVAPPKNK